MHNALHPHPTCCHGNYLSKTARRPYATANLRHGQRCETQSGRCSSARKRGPAVEAAKDTSTCTNDVLPKVAAGREGLSTHLQRFAVRARRGRGELDRTATYPPPPLIARNTTRPAAMRADAAGPALAGRDATSTADNGPARIGDTQGGCRCRDARVDDGDGLEIPRELKAGKGQDVSAGSQQHALAAPGAITDHQQGPSHLGALPHTPQQSKLSPARLRRHCLPPAGPAPRILRRHQAAHCHRHHRGTSEPPYDSHHCDPAPASPRPGSTRYGPGPASSMKTNSCAGETQRRRIQMPG